MLVGGAAQYQAVHLISALTRHVPGWLRSNKVVTELLRVRWASPARAQCLANEEQLAPAQLLESKRLVKCFLVLMREVSARAPRRERTNCLRGLEYTNLRALRGPCTPFTYRTPRFLLFAPVKRVMRERAESCAAFAGRSGPLGGGGGVRAAQHPQRAHARGLHLLQGVPRGGDGEEVPFRGAQGGDDALPVALHLALPGHPAGLAGPAGLRAAAAGAAHAHGHARQLGAGQDGGGRPHGGAHRARAARPPGGHQRALRRGAAHRAAAARHPPHPEGAPY
eukprot:1175750-Prorocentrum_minimum.AAC.2